jgi:hypothetical protein
MGTRGSFPLDKWPGRDVDHSPSSSAEVKKAWSYTSTQLKKITGTTSPLSSSSSSSSSPAKIIRK